MRQVLLRDGRLAWVNDDGQVVRISSGMGGAEPGFGQTSQSNLPPPGVYHPDARTRDLMSRLPDADIVGLRGHGVVPGGEQSVSHRRETMAEISHERSPVAPTFRPLAGAQQNNRGQIQNVVLPTLTGGPVQIVPSIVETPKANGWDSESLSVQLGMDIPQQMQDPSDPYFGVPIDVTAVFDWGVGAAFFTAELDWNQGVSFTVSASFVRVSARVGAVTPFLIPDIGIVLKAALSYGNSISMNVSSPIRRTVRLNPSPVPLIGPGATKTVAVPLWAMGFTLVDAGAVGGFGAIPPDYTISCGGALYKMVSRTNLGGQVEGQFPVPSGSRQISVTNNLGVAMIDPRLIFNLGF